MEKRPSFIAHWADVRDPDDARYPGSDELLSIGSPLGKKTGLTRIGVHHEILPPGRRTSFPHAEADEDELVYVLEGAPTAWVDGETHEMREGEAIGFPCGTGIAHAMLNDTDGPVRLLVIGEASKKEHRIHYPLHPERNREIGARHWHDAPERTLGPHAGRPSRAPVPVGVPVLETERLVLRAHRPSDAADVFTMRTHPEATKFLSLGPPTAVAEIEQRLRRVIARTEALDMYGWSMTLRGDDACIGLLGLVRLDRTHRSAEIAYELTHAHWGQGYAREAVARVIAFAFGDLGLHRLEIRTDPANERSAKVARALDFTYEGRLRQDERRPDGTYCDSLVFSKLAID
jgi:RimJ/RimL family protein N-acetyltransferase/uncharacterized cupin superfamily protein